MDVWEVDLPPVLFFERCRTQGICVYECTITKDRVHFYASLLQRRRIRRVFETARLLYTSGMTGYFLRSFRKPQRIAALLLSAMLWLLLSSCIFEIRISGEEEACKQAITDALREKGYQPPFRAASEDEVKRTLKERTADSISWLEVERIGSRYHIRYTPKRRAEKTTAGREELVARKDGVIQRFDIQHGEKKAAVSQVVHKGDLLVANTLTDSKGKQQELFVEGRVFAYTWRDVRIEMKDEGIRAFQYFEALMEARRSVSADFHKDDEIVEENILQFQREAGKINMVIHYTLLQDITTP